MQTPFANDMFAMIYKAFRDLYPDKDCKCQWVCQIGSDDEDEAFGETIFEEETGEVYVNVKATLTVADAAEVFAHELAHVAVGKDTQGHGKEWQDAFDAINERYEKNGLDAGFSLEEVEKSDNSDN